MRGQHYRVESAKLWDLPAQRVPMAVAVSGPRSCALFAPLADHMIAVETNYYRRYMRSSAPYLQRLGISHLAEVRCRPVCCGPE
jgi:alkanesulfonate monooxygenase SsuD/methylene tetrahydromethanopterin reductase-like flavin-dependent oxidoreductase (luciferase family)